MVGLTTRTRVDCQIRMGLDVECVCVLGVATNMRGLIDVSGGGGEMQGPDNTDKRVDGESVKFAG